MLIATGTFTTYLRFLRDRRNVHLLHTIQNQDMQTGLQTLSPSSYQPWLAGFAASLRHLRELPFDFLGEGERFFSEQSIFSLYCTQQTIHSEINIEAIYFLLPTNYLFWLRNII